MTRRFRREEARKNGVPFEPQYNAPVTKVEFKVPNNKYHFLFEKGDQA